MAVVNRLIGLASPAAALRRGIRLSEQGRLPEAFGLFTAAARAGIADAEYRVARCYLEGSGVPPSRAEGVRWLHRAATHGYAEAQALLSALCVNGLGTLASGNPAEGKSHADHLFTTESKGDPDFNTAIKWARQAAKAGSPKGQALLAYILTCGPDSMRDVDEAHRWYALSAARGCPEGCLGYALSLARQGTNAKVRKEIAELLRAAAKAGLPTAIYLLAALTEHGVGVARDLSAAGRLYRDAAEKGLRSAQLHWGVALFEGRYGEKDPIEGESWVRRAALAGDPEAAAFIGNLYVRHGPLPANYSEAAGWYRRAAEAGHAAAARALGSLYLTGAGVVRDPAEATRWLRISADSGDPASQADLANLLLEGAGTPDDRAKVASWFEQAAVSGDLVAAFNFGLCLAKGVGIERDEQQATHWLRRAADGVADAQYIYGRMLADGRGVAPDLREARAWFARAADADVADAQVALAEMMVNGRGGAFDPAAALVLFEKAAAKGHSGAMFALGALHCGGHDLPEDRQVAQRWFRAAAERGHGQAQLMLGRYLVGGLAGQWNPAEGRLWLERAAAQGISDAEPDLAALTSSASV